MTARKTAASSSFALMFVLVVLMITTAFAAIRPINRQQQQQLPGYYSSLSQSALQYMSKQAVPLIVSQVMSTQLSDINQEVHTPIGAVDFDLTGLHIDSFSIGDLQVPISQGVGVQVNVNNIQLSVNGNWNYREKSFPHLSDHGTLDMNAGMTMNVLIHISADVSTGKLMLSVDPNAVVSLDNLQLKLHGGQSWLYNTFISAFQNKIAQSIHDTMIKMITGDLNQRLQQESAEIDYVVPVGKAEYGLVADFSVLQAVCNSTLGLVSIGTKGEILVNKTGALPYPGAAAPFVPLSQGSEMINIVATDFLFNTAGWSAYQDGFMQILVTNAMIPSSVPIKLNTAMFKATIPGLYQKYPDTEMQLLVSDTGKNFENAPKVTIAASNGLMLSTIIDMEWSVVLNTSQVVPVFVLNTTVTVEGKATVAPGNLLTAAVQLDTLIVGVESSQVGAIDVNALTTFIRAMVQYIALPLVNKELQTGFQIPTFEGIELQNPQLTFQDRYFTISSDFTYTPAKSLPTKKQRYHL